LLATTREFLDDFGLRSLQELPPIGSDATATSAKLELPFPELGIEAAALAAANTITDTAEILPDEAIGADAVAANGLSLAPQAHAPESDGDSADYREATPPMSEMSSATP
jgi:segregation and condensation protein B